MTGRSDKAVVMLVGFEDQDNLGLRYLASSLQQEGHSAIIIPFRDDPLSILSEISIHQPHIIGFSLIFQFYAERFASLINSLRAAGVTAHFTIGGHYASFEPELLFDCIPGLDSIVRFEGEETLNDLSASIVTGQDWRAIPGIAYRDAGKVNLTKQRVGKRQLDDLPWPYRDDINYITSQFPTASIIGGRGCPWVCSFCSIITFYEGNGTRGRRLRNPKLVADEIEYLHRERGVRIILWQDDDFLAGGKKGVRWAHDVAGECIRRGLHHDLRWKISCRSDEVKPETMEPLVEAGLTHVYLGVESGDPESLKRMNKVMEPASHFRAAEVIKQLNLSFDFGFMLMEPWCDFQTIRNNIRFLREFAGDGYSVAGYCRMLPYAGTGIEKKLLDEGRLDKKDLHADYQFNTPWLDAFFKWQLQAFHNRNHGPSGTNNLLRLLLFESHLDFRERPYNRIFCQKAIALSSLSNQFLLNTLEKAVDHFESMELAGNFNTDTHYLDCLAREHAYQDRQLRNDILQILSGSPESLRRRFVTV